MPRDPQHAGRLLATGIGIGVALGLLARAARRSYSFAGRTVVISGGSRGLGLVLARQLAGDGANLALLAREGDELDIAATELAEQTQVIPIVCDVTDQRQVEDAVAQVVNRFGGIDVLINNAGTIQMGPLEHMSVDDFREAIDLHVFGPLYTTFAALPHLRAAGDARVVNIASIGGMIATPHLLPYCTSKFGLVGLSEGLRAELRKYNILVTTVCPGLMRTGSPPNAFFKGRHREEYAWFAAGDANPLLSIAAERAAHQIIDATRRGQARLIITLQARLAVLFHGLAPETFARFMELTNQLLPPPDPHRATERYTGWESFSRLAPSALTAPSDAATIANNE